MGWHLRRDAATGFENRCLLFRIPMTAGSSGFIGRSYPLQPREAVVGRRLERRIDKRGRIRGARHATCTGCEVWRFCAPWAKPGAPIHGAAAIPWRDIIPTLTPPNHQRSCDSLGPPTAHRVPSPACPSSVLRGYHARRVSPPSHATPSPSHRSGRRWWPCGRRRPSRRRQRPPLPCGPTSPMTGSRGCFV